MISSAASGWRAGEPRARLAAWCIAAIALAASSAAAQPSPGSPEHTAAARALFDEGMRAVDAGDWPAAADQLRRSFELRASPVVRYNLALALSELGRVVEASEHLRAIQREAAPGSEVRRLASERLELVLPRLGSLRIEVSGPREGVEVRLDGAVMPDALVGVVQPADPGLRRVTLLRVERGVTVELANRALTVESGRAASIDLEVPPLAVPTPAEVARDALAHSSPDAPPPDDAVERQWWFWTILGVLVIGAGVAIAAGVTASTQQPPPPFVVGDSGLVHPTLLEVP